MGGEIINFEPLKQIVDEKFNRIFLFLIIVLIVAMAGIFWFSYREIYEQQQENLLENITYFTDTADEELTEIEETYNQLLAESLRDFYAGYESPPDREYLYSHMEELENKLAEIENENVNITSINYYFIDDEGIIFDTDYEEDLNFDLSQADVWTHLEELEAGEVHLDPFTAETATHKIRLYAYINLPDGNIFEIGLLFDDSYIRALENRLERLTGEQVSQVTFFDYGFQSFFPAGQEASPESREKLERSLQEDQIKHSFTFPFSESFYYGWETEHTTGEAPRFLKADVSYTSLLQLNTFYGITLVIFLIMLLIFRRSLNRMLMKEVVSPLSTIRDEIASFNLEEEKSMELAENRPREIEDIKNEYMEMAEEVSASYQQIAAYSEEISQLNQELEYQAQHDPLTDLPNRRKFLEELENELEEGRRGAVVLLDLDNFKEINDTRGHVFGDKLLRSVSERLAAVSSQDNIFAARYGGDEFLLLLRNIEDKEEIHDRLNALESEMIEPMHMEKEIININYSLGVCTFPDDALDPYELITRADTAMYQAKSELNNNKKFFQDHMIDSLKEKQEIKEILQEALHNNGFELNYQPLIDMESRYPVKYEALLRLKNYDISPGKFIPIAEESQLIIEIGRWVTEAVIARLASWSSEKGERSPKPVNISMNFSVRQLNDDEYLDFLEEKLNQYEVSPQRLSLEITESILLEESQKAQEFLNRLREIGVNVMLDDFGRGYSSLNYITFMNLDVIKLDRSLCNRFLDGENDETIQKLIELFHSLELEVVAEGIEAEEKLSTLKNMNCDYVQGFIFSRPVSVSEAEKMADRKF